MIQDIAPSRLYNEYHPYELRDEDRVCIFDNDGKMFLNIENGRVDYVPGSDITEDIRGAAIYLFAIDDKRYFLVRDTATKLSGYEYYSIRDIRDKATGPKVYACFTAYHLWRWYSDNIFCGKCASKLTIGTRERSLVCPDCGNTIYPRLNPAVIVGVTKGDHILITKYKTGYAYSALVAGFTEIGETLEECVMREVMEETGVEVSNICYYKSQPWGMAQDILVGFYCDAVGDGKIHMDDSELKYAEWVKREDIELQPNNLSLTNEMMKMFKDGKV